jgi:hypothetical protein
MGGRFGKYGDIKRKAALRKSRKVKDRLWDDVTPEPKRKRKKKGKHSHKKLYKDDESDSD